MTMPHNHLIVIAASLSDPDRAGYPDRQGLIITPRTRDRVRGTTADAVRITPAAWRLPRAWRAVLAEVVAPSVMANAEQMALLAKFAEEPESGGSE